VAARLHDPPRRAQAFLIALLDATNIVPEANESNNVVVSPAVID